MSKLLLMLQFWEGDKAAALDLARLIADIEPKHSDQADIILCARRDATHDPTVVDYLSRKFNVYTHTATRGGKGWPQGPNTLFFDSMRHVIRSVGKTMPPYRAILAMESDDVPLSRDWIRVLLDEMDKLQSNVVGAFQNTPVPHCNGNCLFNGDPEFLAWLSPNLSCNVNRGWDAELFPKFAAKGFSDTLRIRSYWNIQSLDDAQFKRLVDQGTVLLHGIKSDCGRQWARRNLL